MTEVNLRSLGIVKTGDLMSLIDTNNSLPYKRRDKRLSVLYDCIMAYNKSKSQDKMVINDSKKAYDYLKPDMENLQQEEVYVLFLNKAGGVIQKKRMFAGGIDSTVVDNRLVIKEAILCGATQIILAHNHPSGSVKPSRADEVMTEKLKNAAKVCDISLIDHIIVGKDRYYSFSDELKL